MVYELDFEPVVVASRFRGPPNSANGGYVCGVVAETLGGDVEVTLRSPPPLERPMTLVARGERERELWCDEQLVARGRRRGFDLEQPAPTSWEQACRASRRYVGFQQHPFPGCFVCGPKRPEGDGLRIFPGPLADHRVAAPWIPDQSICSRNGNVRTRFLWAALDCPGYFAAIGSHGQTLLLGRMAARIHRPVRAAEPCVILGWRISSEGRKYRCGTALFSESAELLAEALATWIEVRKPRSAS